MAKRPSGAGIRGAQDKGQQNGMFVNPPRYGDQGMAMATDASALNRIPNDMTISPPNTGHGSKLPPLPRGSEGDAGA